MELDEARKIIDSVDAEMTSLFEKRMHAVREIAAVKAKKGLPVSDPARELAVIEKNCARLSDPALAVYYEAFLKAAMAVSRDYQRDLLGTGEAL